MDTTKEEIYFNSTLLSKLRQTKRLSLRKLGTEVKISHSLLCNYETNRRIPTLKNLLRLEDFFNLERGSLLIKKDVAVVETASENIRNGDVCVEKEFALRPL